MAEPLWKVMDDAAMWAQKSGRDGKLSYAAEIRAIAKWVEMNTAASYPNFTIHLHTLWKVTGLLLAEADRAEKESQ